MTTKKKSSAGVADDALFDWTQVEDANEVVSLVDIGANLADSCFDPDRLDVVNRARCHGRVSSIVVTGTSLAASRRALDVASDMAAETESPRVFATAGVHPHDVGSLGDAGLDGLMELVEHPRCVAVGECGLDYNRDFSPRDVQRRFFEAQLRLAVDVGKPVFAHCREAADDLASIIECVAKDVQTGNTTGTEPCALPVPVVVHCFTGSVAEAQRFVSLGCSIGFTGWICDEREGRNEQMAEVIKVIPDDRLMIETDAPYLPPRSIKPGKLRPRRNEPCLLPYVLHAVAEARQTSMKTVADLTTANATRFFGL